MSKRAYVTFTGRASCRIDRPCTLFFYRSFEWCHRWFLRPPIPPKMGVPYAPNMREWPYLRNGWSDTLHVWF